MIEVVIAGATGAVGQQLVAYLQERPSLKVVQLIASSRHGSKIYQQAAKPWIADTPLSSLYGQMPLDTLQLELKSKIVFSALPSDLAAIWEPNWRDLGCIVISLASAMRINPEVPLAIFDINLHQLKSVRKKISEGKGVIICKPNCVATILATFIKPLLEHQLYRVDAISLQSLSGAGYPGPSAWLMNGNYQSFIDGEEEKIEQEIPKIFGSLSSLGLIKPLKNLEVNANCVRLPVVRGHSLILNLYFENPCKLCSFRNYLKTSNYIEEISDLIDLAPVQIMSRKEPLKVFWGKFKQIKPNVIQVLIIGDNLGRGASLGAIELALSLQSYLGKAI